ncbi:ferrous iron transporter B [Pseudoxanthomonas gei]|uniref:Ferrous iron transporter B n=2 Tax=Pseudoxanthomonas gei TaxID=1383030 RepID=A0ABX0AAU3_9GAMM|nr:FimV/HubP family polar landmark protein [Pseudoxanthomonas gei]NDK38672.1 ferrous iron transporter B [Pseudoxanthomonas gei]
MFSTAAMALGLGEIRVKSQPGQPLLAEIPIISTEPGELEQLQARLASPVTFERVGLARPEGLVSGLGFAVGLDDAGKAVIRVTSTEPVQVAAVNFLIEVDWGQGRLVREYSALVDTPSAVATASQPIIEAATAAPSNTIIRDATPIAASGSSASPTEAAAAPETATPAPARAVAAVAPPAPASAASGEVQVQRGQTLSQIASGLGQDYRLDQTMLALLRANPDAFINGNINLLKQGAVLRVPPSAEVAQLGESEAAALVRDQLAEWRQARRPIPQPVEARAAAAAAPALPPRAAAPAAPQVAQARLEIAPPAASAAKRAGTQSGVDAEGEGDMLANQQLVLTKEELAARESEVRELRAQVSELEGLKQQQAKLIAMKDSELAAAQQRLAQNQGGASQPLWLWAGLGLLVAGLVVAWLISRRKPSVKASPRTGYDSAALAAAMPVSGAVAAPVEAEVDEPLDPDFDNDYEDGVPAALAEADDESAAEDAGAIPAPAAQAWTSAAVKPTWHTGEAGLDLAPLNPAPAGRERLELAIAYLDLGDVETARGLLGEVAAGGDAAARDEATQLLRDIG